MTSREQIGKIGAQNLCARTVRRNAAGEDAALVQAIDEGLASEPVSKQHVLDILRKSDES